MTIDVGQLAPWLGGAIVALIAAGSAWLTSKIQHQGKPENAIIDQLQENQASQSTRMASMERRIAAFEERDVLYIPHIIRLNAHIERELGPPAPRMPKAIQAYLDEQEEEGHA